MHPVEPSRAPPAPLRSSTGLGLRNGVCSPSPDPGSSVTAGGRTDTTLPPRTERRPARVYGNSFTPFPVVGPGQPSLLGEGRPETNEAWAAPAKAPRSARRAHASLARSLL